MPVTAVKHDLRVDVSDAVPFVEAELAVTLITPDELSGPRIVAFGFPGGGYGRRYWDIDWPGGYSQAAHHVDRGWLFVVVDHLGVGESTLPDPESMTIEMLAAANDAAVRRIVLGLTAGTLVDGLDPVDVRAAMGMGQSMGGCLSIVAQANHATFDGLAVLGYSGRHTVLPSPAGGVAFERVERGDTAVATLDRTSATLSAADVFTWAFHWEDVDPEIRRADVGQGYPVRSGDAPPWASSTIPPCAVSMMTEGVVAAEAAAVDIPLFLGFGERDVSPDPWLEPSAYRNSSDITLVVVPRMAHMHNFAGTRQQLWERLHGWGEGVASSLRRS